MNIKLKFEIFSQIFQINYLIQRIIMFHMFHEYYVPLIFMEELL